MSVPDELGKGGLPIAGFADLAAFSQWLDQQPANSTGLWLRLAKKGSATLSLSKQQAIDAALCHGWIDGQLGTCDANHFLVRFTPRKARSKWSQINCTRAEQLISEGLMTPDGLMQVTAAKADGRWDAAYAPASTVTVPDDLQAALGASPAAAAFFAKLTGANRYAILYRIGSVKRAETRARKIAGFVAMMERGETIHG